MNIAFGGLHFDERFAANPGRWHIARMPAGVRRAPTTTVYESQKEVIRRA